MNLIQMGLDATAMSLEVDRQLRALPDESPLSPAEVELADRVAEPPLPVLERDAVLTAGDLRIDLTLRAYGRYIPQCGVEPAFYDIDRVTVGGPDGEDEIFNALTPADFSAISGAATGTD